MKTKKDVDFYAFLKEFRIEVKKNIEEYFPRKIKIKNKKFVYAVGDKKAVQKSIINPFYDLIDRGGKCWRPTLMYLVYKSLGGRNEKLIKKFLCFPEIIHNASLVHDDIEDDAEIRRGKSCIHKIYGKDVSINLGGYMYFLPLLFLQHTNLSKDIKLEVYNLYTKEMNNIHLGQAQDIYWHNKNKFDISYKQYSKMCASKTGVLARLSAKLGAILANSSEKEKQIFYNFAEKIGVAFQIQDDILDLKNTGQFQKLHGCQDIKEGKKTLIILHTIKNANKKDKKELINILDKNKKTKEDIKKAINIIKKYKSIDFAKKYAIDIVKKNIKIIKENIKESKYKDLILDFAYFVISRDI